MTGCLIIFMLFLQFTLFAFWNMVSLIGLNKFLVAWLHQLFSSGVQNADKKICVNVPNAFNTVICFTADPQAILTISAFFSKLISYLHDGKHQLMET